MTLFTQSGRYYKQMRPSDAESLTQLFDQHAITELPQFADENAAKHYHYYTAPYFFAGVLQKNQRTDIAITSRSTLTVQLNYVAKKFKSVENLFEALSKNIGFEFFLYPTFDNQRRGVRALMLVPLKTPATDPKTYQYATNYLRKMILGMGFVQRLGSTPKDIWSKPDPMPVQGSENQTYYHFVSKFGNQLDIASKQFTQLLTLQEASGHHVADQLAEPTKFEPSQHSATEIVQAFVDQHADWLSDYLNWVAASMAIKRAELREDIDHDEALQLEKILANGNPDWENHNLDFYEDLDLSEGMEKGSGLEFFITKAEQSQFDWLEFDKRGNASVNAAKLGVELIKKYHYFSSELMHMSRAAIYVDQQWRLVGAEAIMQKYITDALMDAQPVLAWHAKDKSDVWSFVKSHSVKDKLTSDPFETAPHRYLVQFKNGTVDLKTMTLRENRPQDYLLHAVPYNYPETDYLTPDTTLAWLKDLVGGDEQAVDYICAFVGMAFTQGYDKQQMLMLAGDGNNGKTTVINYLRSLFEPGAVTEVSLADLASGKNRFTTSNLYGKNLAITNESGNSFIKNADMLKKVTGGDATSMEFKGRNAFSTVSYAALIGASNDLPTIADRTEGLKRRLVVVKLTNNFGKQAIKDRFKKAYPKDVLDAEKPDFIRYCLEHFYESVLAPEKDDYFQISDDMQKNIDSWSEQGDNVKDFFETYCIVDKDVNYGERKLDLYKLYRWFTFDDESYTLSRDRFIKDICRVAKLNPQTVVKRCSIRKEQAVRVCHICFNQDALNAIYADAASTRPRINFTGYLNRGSYILAGEARNAKFNQQTK